MRRFLSVLSLIALAACTIGPSAQTPNGDDFGTLHIALVKEQTEGADGIPLTSAILQFYGAAEGDVQLGDIQGDLMYVNPESYGIYAREDGDIVAVLTSWFAGAGDEFIITHLPDANLVVVEHIEGGEEGVCTDAQLIAEVELSPDVTSVLVEDFGEPIDQSSLAFCHGA